MNIHDVQISHIRHQSAAEIRANAAAVRKRLFASGKPKQNVVVFRPLWKLQDLHFDQHVTDFRNKKSPQETTRVYIRDRAKELGFRYDDIVGDRRFRGLVSARQLIIAEVREKFPHLSLPQIGRIFGGRDHTTILHAINRVSSGEIIAPSALTNAHIQAIKDDIDKQMSRKQICAKHGVSAASLRYLNIKRGLGLKVSPKQIPLRAKIERVRELYDAGETLVVIADKMGVGTKRISAFIKSLGWKRDPSIVQSNAQRKDSP